MEKIQKLIPNYFVNKINFATLEEDEKKKRRRQCLLWIFHWFFFEIQIGNSWCILNKVFVIVN